MMGLLWRAFPILQQLEMHFMPIVRFSRVRRLVHWDTIGYEALVRGPHGTPLQRPDVLFALAGALGLKRALDLWCIESSMRRLTDLPLDASLFINVAVDTMLSPEFEALTARSTAYLERRQVVFEILEGHIPSISSMRDRVASCMNLGYRFAIDDIGAHGSSLERMVELGPVHFLKLDRTFLTRVWPEDTVRARAWLGLVRETARVTGAQIVLEGIEEANLGQLAELHRLGIELGQGYLFGKASALEHPSETPQMTSWEQPAKSKRTQPG